MSFSSFPASRPPYDAVPSSDEEHAILWQGFQDAAIVPAYLSPSSSEGSSAHVIPSNAGHAIFRSATYPESTAARGLLPQRHMSAPNTALSALMAAPTHPPSLKRASSALQEPYGDGLSVFDADDADIRPGHGASSVGQDHHLLSFRRLLDKTTLLDRFGNAQRADIVAQIHGMFFLTEILSTGDEPQLPPELTCYRRNLFQISGAVSLPRGPCSVITEQGLRLSILSQELQISASESFDASVVRLIVVPLKTPLPNEPEPDVRADREPAAIPLTPHPEAQPDQDAHASHASYSVAWRRLQFRVATANNGRRKELQQHFVLRLSVVATLSDGSTATVAEALTAPIVVRGRSPRNFQTRKEIPLLGASAVARGLMAQQSPPTTVSQEPSDEGKALRPQSIALPTTTFDFDASQLLLPSPVLLRQV